MWPLKEPLKLMWGSRCVPMLVGLQATSNANVACKMLIQSNVAYMVLLLSMACFSRQPETQSTLGFPQTKITQDIQNYI